MIRSKYTVLVVMIALLLLAGEEAFAADSHHPVNFSLFYPVSTNQDPNISTSFRLNLIYGRVGSIKGLDINGIVGRTGRDFKGIQLTGLVSHTGGEFRGAAITGGFNYLGSYGKGLQVAGGINYNRGDFSGIQYSGLFNFIEGDFKGIQLTSFFNLSNGRAKAIQVASIANVVSEEFRGVQAAGAFNFVNDRMTGVQAGLTNFALTTNGLQAGILNFTQKTHGGQVGIVNYTRDQNEGVPVGVLNLADNSDADWVTFASNLALLSTGVRTTVRRFYSVLAAGTYDIQEERSDTWFLSWNYGYRLQEHDKWNLDADAGFVHIHPQQDEDPGTNDELHFAIQVRLLVEFELSKKVSIFGGGGFSSIFAEYSTGAETTNEPLLVGGVSLY